MIGLPSLPTWKPPAPSWGGGGEIASSSSLHQDWEVASLPPLPPLGLPGQVPASQGAQACLPSSAFMFWGMAPPNDFSTVYKGLTQLDSQSPNGSRCELRALTLAQADLSETNLNWAGFQSVSEIDQF